MVTGQKKRVGVSVKPEKCTGCRVCQMECSFKYHKVFNPALSNIQILETPDNTVSFQIIYKDDCRDCLTCVKSCVYGALTLEKGDK